MKRLLGMIGATLGSAIGWWVGALIGFMSAFMFCIVGTGLGLYFGSRLAKHLLP